MSRRMSESPDKPPFGRQTSPLDPWRTRSPNPNNYGHNYNPPQPTAPNDHHALRPLLPLGANPYPNFGNQRFFTPRCSYFGQQNPNPVFNSSSAPHVNQDFNYGSNEPSTTVRPNPTVSYGFRADANRPVYMTPDANNLKYIIDTMEVEDMEQIKKAILNANKVSANASASAPQSVSPDSSQNKQFNQLIEDMKQTDEQLETLRKGRKSTENLINQLDEELKEYEKKFKDRETYKKIKMSLERDEEKLESKRKELVKEMERVGQRFVITGEARPRMDTHTEPAKAATKDPKVHKPTDKRSNVEINNVEIKSVLKRPHSSVSKHSLNEIRKKVRIHVESPKAIVKTTPKATDRPPIKRTPIPTKVRPISTSTSSPSVSSPKINRICRQQEKPPTSTTSAVTSGVRTSRPMRPSCSRSRVESTGQTANQMSELQQTPQKTTQSESSAKSSTDSESIQMPESSGDTLSDSEVFEAIVRSIDLQIETNKSQCNTNEKQLISESKTGENVTNDMTSEEKDKSDKNGQQINDNNKMSVDSNVDKTVNKNSVQNEDFDVVTIDSDDDEEYVTESIPSVEIKSEKVDLISESTTESILLPSHKTSDAIISDTLGPQTAPAFNKKLIKYYGFETIEYEPSEPYTIGGFKPIAGPKSKSVVTGVIALKSFQNYMLVSFMDSSVRRYHIHDKTQQSVKYEGHEDWVYAMLIVKSVDSYYLYTGSKDKKLRAFNAVTTQLLNSIELKDQILCLDYNWSHVFCGLVNGTVCKIAPIHELESQSTSTTDDLIKPFVVNAGKRIAAIVSVKSDITLGTALEPVIAVSQNKLRVINTSDVEVRDEERILQSIAVSLLVPIFVKVFRNYLFISSAIPKFKNEEKSIKSEEKSRVLVYDLQKDWKPIRDIAINGVIIGLDLNRSDLIVSCSNGQIRCIDCLELEIKWITYGSLISSCVKIGDRLVLGTVNGFIEVIFLDQKMVNCDSCGITFARHIDFKQHIQLEHKISEGESTVPELESSSTNQ